MTSNSHDQHEPQQPTLGRRRLVRAGATLAWTVPAISVVAAAPALAVSGCCHLSVSGTAGWRTGGLNYFDMPLTITNDCAGAVTGLTLTLLVCGVKNVEWAGAEYLPAGWTQLGKGNTAAPSAGGGCYTLTFVTAQSLAGHGVMNAQFTGKSQAYVGTGNHRPAGTIAATVSTTGCTSPTTVINLPKVG